MHARAYVALGELQHWATRDLCCPSLALRRLLAIVSSDPASSAAPDQLPAREVTSLGPTRILAHYCSESWYARPSTEILYRRTAARPVALPFDRHLACVDVLAHNSYTTTWRNWSPARTGRTRIACNFCNPCASTFSSGKSASGQDPHNPNKSVNGLEPLAEVERALLVVE
eukprot:1852310-Rhodomonas_salina.3